MSDLNELASRMFPSMANPGTAEQAAPSGDSPAPPTGEPRETSSDAEKLSALYSTEAYRDVTLVEEKGTLDEDPTEIAEQNEAHRDQMWALQLSEPEAERYTALVKGAPTFTDEDRAGWQTQTAEILSRYTPEEARERLDVVTQWLRRSPGLAQQIIDAKLVGHPELLRVALEKSWSAKARGEF